MVRNFTGEKRPPMLLLESIIFLIFLIFLFDWEGQYLHASVLIGVGNGRRQKGEWTLLLRKGTFSWGGGGVSEPPCWALTHTERERKSSSEQPKNNNLTMKRTEEG
jgi:hypothetical protein